MLSLLYGPALTSIRDYRKNRRFDYMDLCWKVMSLLFNMLSRLVITFLLRSKRLLYSQQLYLLSKTELTVTSDLFSGAFLDSCLVSLL